MSIFSGNGIMPVDNDGQFSVTLVQILKKGVKVVSIHELLFVN